LVGQTPFYPVTVKAGEVAAANSVTLNDFNDNTPATLRPELDIAKGPSLAIGDGGLDLNADSILKNFGTLSVGTIASLLGKAEILGSSVLDNAGGFITLNQGGDFKGSSSITNSGTIEVAGGALDVEVAIANAGGIIQVDDVGGLKLNGTAINGGTVTGSGTVDVTANSSINGTIATPAIVDVSGVTVESGIVLTLDDVT